MTDPTALTYLEHLTDGDLALLGESGRLRREPDRILERLARPETYEAVFGPGGADEPFLRASPFLTFAVAVHRAAEELGASTFTREWVAPRQRVPVFDAQPNLVLINFEDITGEESLITDQYAGLGVTFSGGLHALPMGDGASTNNF